MLVFLKMKLNVEYFILVILLSIACGRKVVSTSNATINFSESVDYSSMDNWAAHPNKKDPSDRVPAPLQQQVLQDSTVDIFFLHPTTFFDNNLIKVPPQNFASPLWNANQNNTAINDKTDNSTILYQASIFNNAGRVFAPRYRQANYYAYFTKDTINAIRAFDLAYQDVRQAFMFYLKHYNKGRPIVIASHSQGTNHAKLLLKEFFDQKLLMKQLVVAYLVGMPVEKTFFQGIPVCADSLQTGCFCSWRTLKEGYLTEFIKKETKLVAVTNPLSWDTSAIAVSRKTNDGTILLNFNKIITKTTGGRIYKNVVWVNKPRFFGNVLYQEKNYHIGDYNLFYVSVRKNAVARVRAYKRRNMND